MPDSKITEHTHPRFAHRYSYNTDPYYRGWVDADRGRKRRPGYFSRKKDREQYHRGYEERVMKGEGDK